jgi:hypothetical protein
MPPAEYFDGSSTEEIVAGIESFIARRREQGYDSGVNLPVKSVQLLRTF